jgi:hypothetical protein
MHPTQLHFIQMATNEMANPMNIPVCKHWARNKMCLYHSNNGKCKFAHPDDYQVSHIQRHRSTGGRLQTRNDTRVAKLRSFIASHNDVLDLSSCNILDVAGGKGELAFQLLNLSNAASCHVVDPRPLSLTRFQKRLQRGFYHRSASILSKDIVRDQTEKERPVDHLRCFFSDELWKQNEGVSTEEKNFQNAFEKNCKATKSWSWPPIDSSNEHREFINHDLDQCENIDELKETPTFKHASSVVKHANLIVGMHPDQAVDAIVDAALDMNVTFFVVPCCTYSSEFPNRKVLSSNKIVTTYEELLDYLQCKSPDIKRHTLPFEGKNVCLYRIVT